MPSRLVLELLGLPQVYLDDQPVATDRRKAIALLAYLAVSDSGQARQKYSRESLSALFWPDYVQSKAFSNLRRTIWEIHQAIGEEWLIAERESVQLNPEAEVDLDVADFVGLVSRARQEQDTLRRASLLADSVKLYRDHFLTGFSLKDAPNFNEWAFAQSEDLRRQLAEALVMLSEDYCALGQAEKAIPHARRLVALDPLNESSHRQLMQVYLAAGQPAAALKQYQTCEQILRKEMGLDPQPETYSLYKQIRKGELKPKSAKQPTGQALPHQKIPRLDSIESEVTETLQEEEISGNLPLQLTSFIGREAEIEELKRLLQGAHKVRLLSLVGAGGSGKTRLALRIAEQIMPGYPDGVWFIDLAPVADPTLVPRVTAATLGILESQGEDITAKLAGYLRRKKILILLDNCEHVLKAATELAGALLRACPDVQILATTREVLNIPGETHFHLMPLPFPPEGSVDKSTIARFDAVQMFVQRARNAQPNFDLTEENAPHIAEVCRRLDGMPLAIELAAARVGLLRVQQIEAQLQDRFHLLTSGSRTLPRHQTLQAMIDWSHDLLSEPEQILFRRLSVFAGGWTLEAAEGMAPPGSQASTLDLLSRLVDKSFILVERNPGREARYTILESLRAYALDRLEAAQEADFAREQHFEYFCRLARHARLYGPEKQIWLDRLEADYDNIRAAVTWALAASRSENVSPYIEETTELILAITDFFWFRGYTVEARRWMDHCLAIEMPPSPLRALLLQKAGWFARGHGDFKKADILLRRALEMAKGIGDRSRSGWALMDLGLSARDQGDNQQAISYFSEAFHLVQESGDVRGIAACLYFLAESHVGDLEKSGSLWEQGLNMFQGEGDTTHIAWGLEGLAGVAYLKRDFASALKFHSESLRIKAEVMDKLGIAHSLEGLAQLAAQEEEPERAVALWAAANHLRERMGTPTDPSREDLYISLIPRTREQIGDALFEAAWKTGEGMKLEEVIEYALQAAG